MRKSLILLLLFMVLLPLGFTVWAGLQSLDKGREDASNQVKASLANTVREVSAAIMGFVRKQENYLLDLATETQGEEDKLLELSRNNPIVRQAFLVRDGKIVYPPRVGGSVDEENFFVRTDSIFPGAQWSETASGSERKVLSDAGWRTWFWFEGEQFIIWRRLADGNIVGLELNRAAFLSRLAASLPQAFPNPAEAAGRLMLVRDLRGAVFMQWGAFEPEADTEPLLSEQLGKPFDGWELHYYMDPTMLPAFENQAVWFLTLSGFALVLVVLALLWYLLRELGRDLREARQRVSFVNQVSHELKTPLTNIRLYIELLSDDLNAAPLDKAGLSQERVGERLRIIESESDRLGRLIHNVLSFARKDKDDQPRRRGLVWEDCIKNVVGAFEPSMRDRGLEIVYARNESNEAELDADWIMQIVGNLLSNAEKYAAEGKIVAVETWVDENSVYTRVADNGPGIPEQDRERVFQPFVRLGNKVTDAVGGAGLGLNIARDLARRHGGELSIEASKNGASFLLALPRFPARASDRATG